MFFFQGSTFLSGWGLLSPPNSDPSRIFPSIFHKRTPFQLDPLEKLTLPPIKTLQDFNSIFELKGAKCKWSLVFKINPPKQYISNWVGWLDSCLAVCLVEHPNISHGQPRVMWLRSCSRWRACTGWRSFAGHGVFLDGFYEGFTPKSDAFSWWLNF